MAEFSELFSIVLTAVVLTLMIEFLGGSLAYFVREQFSFKDPDLGWDPTAGLPNAWGQPPNVDLDASDWAEKGLGRR